MEYSINTVGNVKVVTISGELDMHVAGFLYDALMDCADEPDVRLVIDMSGVNFISRAGSRGLLVAAKLAQSRHGEVRICSMQPAVEKFVRHLGFDQLIHVDSTLEEALLALAASDLRTTFPEMTGVVEDMIRYVQDRSPVAQHRHTARRKAG